MTGSFRLESRPAATRRLEEEWVQVGGQWEQGAFGAPVPFQVDGRRLERALWTNEKCQLVGNRTS